MSKSFKGRVVTPGRVKAEALVSHGGFNTLASFQMALMFGDKQVKCGDQNNSDIYKKPMIGKALSKQPACMLFSKPIDSLAASGAILAANWTNASMPVVDMLGDEFLDYVKDGMTVSIGDDGLVTVE